MTYIVGFRRSGFNAIISDARISWEEQYRLEGQNTALKTGLLFPGCMFGRLGSDNHGREFILAAKAAVTGKNTLVGFWERFRDFASSYGFPKNGGDHFQVLLSSRSAGEPELYLLDSRKGLSPVSDDLITLGIGKSLLDPLVEQEYVPRLEEISTKLKEKNHPDRLFPYFMCLWLMELSKGLERSQLESVGVGGVFHFILQTNRKEATQLPALYVLSGPDRARRRVYSWIYRVAFAEGGQVIETLTPPGQVPDTPSAEHERVVLFDTASRPIVSSIDAEPLQRKILEEIKSQPWYFFCGFGFINPTERKGLGFHVTTEGKYVVNQDGEIDSGYQKFIASNFTLAQRDPFGGRSPSQVLSSIPQESNRSGRRKRGP